MASKGYTAKLQSGKTIYIPNWAVDVALENLAQAGKILGDANLINISDMNVPASVVAIMKVDDPKLATQLIKHYICQARIDGNKIEPETINSLFAGSLYEVMEIFCHVIHSQYSDFFDLGLAKGVSPKK